MSRFKQPKKKFFRWAKFRWIYMQRLELAEKRAFEKGVLVCEVCRRTGDEIYICEWCNRCSDPSCNAGCIECRPHKYGESLYPELDRCSCCGQIKH